MTFMVPLNDYSNNASGGSGADIFTLSGSKSFNDDNSSVTIGYTTQNVLKIFIHYRQRKLNSSYGRNQRFDPNNAVPGPSFMKR